MDIDDLGFPYERHTIDLGRDSEGPLTATLVRRLANASHETVSTQTSDQSDRQTEPAMASTAVLYIHGFIDYFFQTHLADFYTTQGLDFYALDLRKYGRSLLEHQTPNHTTDIMEYYNEIDEAVHFIRNVDKHDHLILNGHSTGGLITALWAHDRRDAGLIDGLFLNSPFLDFNGPWITRHVLIDIVASIGLLLPSLAIPFRVRKIYGESIHCDYKGMWNYHLPWKPINGFKVTTGWIRAIRMAHHRVHAGLDITVPVLMATSTDSYLDSRWNDDVYRADVVLDVENISRRCSSLGSCVTLVRINGGVHDLTLSSKKAQTKLFEEVERWMKAHCLSGTKNSEIL